MPDSEDTKPKRVGRPPKKALAAKNKGGRNKVGRPKGEAAIINEYKARMLASPKSEKVMHRVFDVALDDDHKHQAACMKMIMDRVLPISHFDKDKMQSAVGGINITIGVADPEQQVVIDGESAEVDGE